MTFRHETGIMAGVKSESRSLENTTGGGSTAETGTMPRVPDYELLRRIGQGAYGDVWLARGLTGVYRAVKIVWRDRFSEAEPFQREFRGVKESMAHSLEAGQLALLHVGQNESAGFFYYVMELADDAAGGGPAINPARYVPLTLMELKGRRGRRPALECLDLAVKLARSLAAVHARGLVHRDIKPSNVILVNGVAKLADIGLVASTAEARTFVGTQGYLPPEGPGTPAADVFALGKVIYELATGFEHDEFPRLPAEFPDAADRAALFELNEILLRACEPLAEKRYRDAGAMLADLDALQTGRSPRARRVRRVVAKASLALGGIAALVTFAWWRFSPATRMSPMPSATTVAVDSAKSAAPLSEARQLVVRARALFDTLDCTRDDFKLAEDLVEQAKSRDANDAEVWAAAAQLNNLHLIRGWDRSDARREAGRAATQRALRLDSRSFEARFAQAVLLEYTGREGEEKERLLRLLRNEQPQDKRVLRVLAATTGYQGRLDETIRLTNESAALPGGDPLALYDQSRHLLFAGRTMEAEAALQASLAQQPFSSALLLDIWYKIVLHGDLEGARASLKGISPDGLQEDRGAYFAYFVALLQRDAEGALARLRAVPRDWLNDNFYRGPKGLLAGDALLMAGRTEAAAVEWRAALKLVEERLAAQPNDRFLLSNRVVLLAHLADRQKATQEFVVLTQMIGLNMAGGQAAPPWCARGLTQSCILLGRHAEAIGQIRAVLKQQVHVMMDYSTATLRLDPMFDPLRGEPEFQRLLSEIESSERDASAVRTTWRNTTNAPSEARQLAVRARALFDALDETRDDQKLAEELIAQAKAKDAMDPEVAAAEAQLHERFIQRGWDRSDARREAARVATQRALRLDPRSFEARFAEAGLLADTGRDGEEKERQLRVLRSERPKEQRVLRMLASTIARQGRLDEAIPIMNESAALPGGDPLALYDQSRHLSFAGRNAEAEAALEASLAQRPFTSSLLIAIWYKVILHGDLDGARALLDRIPPARLQEDRGAFFAYFVALLQRDADAALARLRAVPRDWLDDSFYRGPKGILMGHALAMAGRTGAAAVEWRAALSLVEERLAAQPNDPLLRTRRVVLLASLAEREKAMREFDLLVQITGIDPAGEIPTPIWITRACILLGRHTDAIHQIRNSLNQPLRALADFTAATLRLDPMYDPLRNEPEFHRLLEEAEGIERKSAQNPSSPSPASRQPRGH